ncbi:MAG TPA: hypothetical protein DCE42_02190 [Myxococcales bacterium]|nr:hypothetical protein [Myxococcales bacterium]
MTETTLLGRLSTAPALGCSPSNECQTSLCINEATTQKPQDLTQSPLQSACITTQKSNLTLREECVFFSHVQKAHTTTGNSTHSGGNSLTKKCSASG